MPAAIICLTGGPNAGWGLDGLPALLPALVGAVLVVAGLALFVWTVSIFATTGRGTLAPWDPTRKLVVCGVYRHVRNPMITGVASTLLGEALVLGSPALMAWFAVFFFANAVYMPLVEERDLALRFGEEYSRYKQSVPRWIPRLRPWSARRPRP